MGGSESDEKMRGVSGASLVDLGLQELPMPLLKWDTCMSAFSP